MTWKEITLPHLTGRSYLHGTTLHRHLVSDLPCGAAICFRIFKIIRGNCVRVYKKSDGVEVPMRCAQLDWSCDGRADSYIVEERPAFAPITYEHYDEEAVLRKTVLDGETAIFEGTSPFDVVATALPILKFLLKSMHQSPSGGKWMFTRWDGRSLSPHFSRLEISGLRLRVATLARCNVLVDGEFFSELYFSWINGL